MKTLTMAASFAILMLAAAPAANAAQTITLSPAAPDGSISGTFRDAGIATGGFTDTFTFVFPQSGVSAATISSILTAQMNNVSFSSVTLDGHPFLVDSTGSYEARHLPAFPSPAGTQTLVVSGNSGGNGSFAGTLAFSRLTAGVPEPASWSMMILGFGGLGAVLRNRRRTQAAVA